MKISRVRFFLFRLICKLPGLGEILSKWKPRVISIVQDQSGILWEVDSGLALDHHKINRNGSMVPESILMLWETLNQNTIAIDVGANAGYWTLPMSFKFSKVIAFEPNSVVRQKLIRNLAVNEIINVEVRDEMCGSKVGVEEFFEISLRDGDGLINNGLSGSFDRGLSIQPIRKNLITLDSLGCSEVAFIKIDTEGTEFHVLFGANTLIATHQPIFFWEASRTLDRNRGLTNVSDSLAFLSMNLYHHFMFLGNKVVECTPDLSNVEMNLDFDVLSIPPNRVTGTKSMLKDFNGRRFTPKQV
jgi:FkbM family methyltransferase